MHFRSLTLALLVLSACGKKTPEAAPPPSTGGEGPATPGATPPPPPNPGTGVSTGGAGDESRRLLAVLQEPIHFDYDRDNIRPEDQAILDRKAPILLSNPNVRIKISGHADERGSDEYNLVLGNRRAASAKRYLESKGIDGSRIETISFGEERPVDNASTEEAWARNRRGEFEVLSGGDRLVPAR